MKRWKTKITKYRIRCSLSSRELVKVSRRIKYRASKWNTRMTVYESFSLNSKSTNNNKIIWVRIVSIRLTICLHFHISSRSRNVKTLWMIIRKILKKCITKRGWQQPIKESMSSRVMITIREVLTLNQTSSQKTFKIYWSAWM